MPPNPSAPPLQGVSTYVRRCRNSSLAGPLILFLICCGFCWKLVLSSGYTWIDNPDIVQMDVPRLQFQQATWRNGEFPLWDPHLWCGQPFLGEIVGAAYPLNWLFSLFAWSRQQHLAPSALNWYFLLIHFLAALFAFWLCGELGVSRKASLLGGFAYSFGGIVGLTLWPEVLGSMLLAPLVLLFLLRALRGYRPLASAALSGMFLGLAWLSGHHEVPIYLSLAVGGIWLYQLFSDLIDWRRSLELAGTTVLFTIFASGLQTLPAYEYSRLAVRWVGMDSPVSWKDTIPYRIDAQNSVAPSSLIGLVVPWAGHHVEVFVGIVVLSLALVAVFTRWDDPFVRLLSGLALAGLLLSLGAWNLLHGLLYATLPLFGKARIPLRLLSIFDLGIAAMAAVGLDGLLTHRHSPVLRSAYRVLIALGAAIFGLGLAAQALQKSGPGDMLYMLGVIALLSGCLFMAHYHESLSNLSVCLAVLALVFIELGNYSAAIYQDRAAYKRDTLLPKLTDYRDIADFLRKQPGLVRVNAEATGAFNFGDWEGIDSVSGFGAGLTSNFQSLNWRLVRTQNLLGVSHSLTTEGARADQQLVFRGSSGVNVFRNVDAFPRAWIVHQIVRASSAEDLRTRLDDASFNTRSTGLLLEPAPALQTCAGDESAGIVKRTANSVAIDARLACRGMLILSDVWYPGWVATVDGAATTIYQADSALRAVVLDGGRHRLEFHYRPTSALLGALMSICGVVGACILARWQPK